MLRMIAKILIFSLVVPYVCLSQTFDFLRDFEINKRITFSFVRTGRPTGILMDTVSRFDDFEGFFDVSTDSISVRAVDNYRVFHLSVRKTGIETIKTRMRIVSTRSVDTVYIRTITEYLNVNHGSAQHRIRGWIIPDTVLPTPKCPNIEDSIIHYRYPYYFRNYHFPAIDTFDLRMDTLVLQNYVTDCFDYGELWEFRLTTGGGFIRLYTYIYNHFDWSTLEVYTKTHVTGLESVRQQTDSWFLYPGFPNPFNLSTHISYRLAAPSHVKLQVYDILGRTVRILVDGYETSGLHGVTFDTDQLPGGVYIYSLRTADYFQSGKLLLVR